MRSRILGTLAGAAALLMSVALAPVASAQSVNCDDVSPPAGESDRVAARQGLLFGSANATDLASSAGTPEAVDAILYKMLCLAANWQNDGVARGGDLNPRYESDGTVITPRINEQDALIMYFTYELTSTMTATGETGQRNRDALLSGTIGSGPNGEFVQSVEELHIEYQKLVVRALQLRCKVSDFNHDWCDDPPVDPDAAFGSDGS